MRSFLGAILCDWDRVLGRAANTELGRDDLAVGRAVSLLFALKSCTYFYNPVRAHRKHVRKSPRQLAEGEMTGFFLLSPKPGGLQLVPVSKLGFVAVAFKSRKSNIY